MIVLNGGWCLASLAGIAIVVAFNAFVWWREKR